MGVIFGERTSRCSDLYDSEEAFEDLKNLQAGNVSLEEAAKLPEPKEYDQALLLQTRVSQIHSTNWIQSID